MKPHIADKIEDYLARAQAGEERPKHKTKDGQRLNSFYRRFPSFAQAMRQTNSKWLRTRTMTVADRKKWILAQPKMTKAMVQYVRNYSTPSSSSFDPDFRAAVKRKGWRVSGEKKGWGEFLTAEQKNQRLKPMREAGRVANEQKKARTFAELMAMTDRPRWDTRESSNLRAIREHRPDDYAKLRQVKPDWNL